MVEYSVFYRSVRFVALAFCAAMVVAFASPASARSHHGHHASQHHHRGHHADRHHVRRHYAHYRGRHHARAARGAALPPFAQNSFAPEPQSQSVSGFGASGVVAEARRFIGGNPTARSRLWCARFMNLVLERSGLHGTGSDMARSFASYGQRVSGPQVGAIAVMSRGRGGGHVGVVSGIDPNGNPIVVSGNHGHRVAESVYPRGRIYAYVMPQG